MQPKVRALEHRFAKVYWQKERGGSGVREQGVNGVRVSAMLPSASVCVINGQMIIYRRPEVLVLAAAAENGEEVRKWWGVL